MRRWGLLHYLSASVADNKCPDSKCPMPKELLQLIYDRIPFFARSLASTAFRVPKLSLQSAKWFPEFQGRASSSSLQNRVWTHFLQVPHCKNLVDEAMFVLFSHRSFRRLPQTPRMMLESMQYKAPSGYCDGNYAWFSLAQPSEAASMMSMCVHEFPKKEPLNEVFDFRLRLSIKRPLRGRPTLWLIQVVCLCSKRESQEHRRMYCLLQQTTILFGPAGLNFMRMQVRKPKNKMQAIGHSPTLGAPCSGRFLDTQRGELFLYSGIRLLLLQAFIFAHHDWTLLTKLPRLFTLCVSALYRLTWMLLATTSSSPTAREVSQPQWCSIFCNFTFAQKTMMAALEKYFAWMYANIQHLPRAKGYFHFGWHNTFHHVYLCKIKRMLTCSFFASSVLALHPAADLANVSSKHKQNSVWSYHCMFQRTHVFHFLACHRNQHVMGTWKTYTFHTRMTTFLDDFFLLCSSSSWDVEHQVYSKIRGPIFWYMLQTDALVSLLPLLAFIVWNMLWALSCRDFALSVCSDIASLFFGVNSVCTVYFWVNIPPYIHVYMHTHTHLHLYTHQA